MSFLFKNNKYLLKLKQLDNKCTISSTKFCQKDAEPLAWMVFVNYEYDDLVDFISDHVCKSKKSIQKCLDNKKIFPSNKIVSLIRFNVFYDENQHVANEIKGLGKKLFIETLKREDFHFDHLFLIPDKENERLTRYYQQDLGFSSLIHPLLTLSKNDFNKEQS